MAVRIYAFAKELGLDNKDLLDVCEKLGIKGKGSALASLDDDEVARIKNQLASSQPEASATSAAPIRNAAIDTTKPPPQLEMRRDDSVRGAVSEPIKELADRLKKKRAQTDTTEPPPEPVAEVVETPANPKDEIARTPQVPESSRVDLMQPVRPSSVSANDRPKNLDRASAKDPKKDSKKPPKKRPAINIAVASMPDVKQPTAGQTAPKEKVQKPDIALPQDVLRKQRIGGPGDSPLTQYTKQHRDGDKPKKKGDKEKGKGVFPDAASPLTGLSSRGKGRKTDKDTAVDLELGSTRQLRTKKRERDTTSTDGDDERSSRRRGPRKRQTKVHNTAAPRKENVVLQLPCTIRSFSEVTGISAGQVLLTLPKIGESMVGKTINSELTNDSVELLLDHFAIEHVDIKAAESLEDLIEQQIQDPVDEDENLEARPPIVTFLGHVDHGKTSLLDAIIGTDVVSGEAGGITQHIRAYQVKKDGKKIAFVDTPGHEAFTEMRARGANVTDIAVLVVAADDGVMPQTAEAISHAKAAGVPIIVAMNKIDLPGANQDKVFQELAAHDLLPSAWGGDVEVVPTSATKKTGIAELLETILVTAELHEYRANPNRAAFGTCLEAEQEPGRGVIAKLMVQGGTLNVGDIVLCGATFGRVKAMYDTLQRKKQLKKSGPSTPVNVTGLEMVPQAGDKFYVLSDISTARQLAISRENKSRQSNLGGSTTRVSLEQFQSLLETGNLGKTADVVTLNLIIRADVRGSIEAIRKELEKIEHPEIRINILQALVGGVTIADVRLAQASQAVIIGFNVVPDEAARNLADDVQVEIRRYDIIYKVADDIKATLEGKLKPEEQIVELGMAMVLKTFSISRTGTVAGCRVMRGNIHRDGRMRLIRESRIIGEYEIDSLKREKDDAREVQRGMECGIKLVGFNDIKEGDTLECYKIEQVARTL